MEFVLGVLLGMSLAGTIQFKSQEYQRKLKRQWRDLAIEAGCWRRSKELR